MECGQCKNCKWWDWPKNQDWDWFEEKSSAESATCYRMQFTHYVDSNLLMGIGSYREVESILLSKKTRANRLKYIAVTNREFGCVNFERRPGE